MSEEKFAIVGLYIAANALIMFALALNVGLRRGAQSQLQPGDMGDAMLTRAIRAHANFSEFAPLVLLLLLSLALLGTPNLLLHFYGILFTAARITHAFGMMRNKHPNSLRFIGNLITGLALLGGAAGLIWFGLVVTR